MHTRQIKENEDRISKSREKILNDTRRFIVVKAKIKDEARERDQLRGDPRKWEEVIDPIGIEQEEALDLSMEACH